MPLNNSMILWPIRFAQTSYVLRVQAGIPIENLTFPVSGTLVAGRDYWLSGDGQTNSDGGTGGIGDLLLMLDECLEAHSSVEQFTATLTSAFRVQTTVSGVITHELLWADAATTLDETIFGFTNVNTGLAATITSPNQPQGIWRPKRPTAIDSRERQPVVGGIAKALSGLQRTSRLVLPRKERDLAWRYLLQAQALQEFELATEPYGSFEEAWVNAISLGRSFRYYPDETVRTPTSYQLYRARELEDPLARNETYKVFWDVDLKAVVS